MTDRPDWLPKLLELGTWSVDTYDRLYEWFKKEILSSSLDYAGRKVWFFRDQEDKRECLFWHLTSRKDKRTQERFPDLERCKRLPWLRPLFQNIDKPDVLHWDHVEGDGTTKTYVWLKEHEYIAIMKKYPDDSRRLITAYWVEYEHERRKFSRKYERRIRF